MRQQAIVYVMLLFQFSTQSQVIAMTKDQEQTSPKNSPELAMNTLKSQIDELLPVKLTIENAASFDEKAAIASSLPSVKKFLDENPELKKALGGLSKEDRYLIEVAIGLNQGPILFNGDYSKEDLQKLARTLKDTERFYSYMGGIAGYHVTTLKLMYDQLAKKQDPDTTKILIPPVTDMRKGGKDLQKMVLDGIYSIDQMAEIYVVGGAGDRLALVDEKTKEPLPVARLQFCGHTLLENLVRDLEAREYLAYKVTGKQTTVPIVLMTSNEKRNDELIQALLKERNYFGRPKESIYRLLQPLTPVIAVDASWAVSRPCELVLKPGGHGVIWKLADEYGAFQFLEQRKKNYLLVRQINNPLAGLDTNLFALAGYGVNNKMGFGFESVPRLPNMSEGMNVLKENKGLFAISNIEYTDFAQKKAACPDFAEIADSPDFPANTNILFADIQTVKNATNKLPVPGFLVNMKHPVDTLRDGKKVVLPGARLESTMQNIADVIGSSDKEKLKTFVLLNDRSKTMSVTKKAFDGKAIQETPEGCFYDLMKENVRLLQSCCSFDVAEFSSPADYIANGPSAIFIYHPALGPLYSVIGQKIQQGRLANGSELEIEAAEVLINNLSVDGSLRIIAECVTGQKNGKSGNLEFSPNVGCIVLKNVRVKNRGIDRSVKNSYFKSQIKRTESAKIELLGNSECIAKDVALDGNFELVVQPETRAVVSQGPDGKVLVEVQPLSKKHPDSLSYKYEVNGEGALKVLNRG